MRAAAAIRRKIPALIFASCGRSLWPRKGKRGVMFATGLAATKILPPLSRVRSLTSQRPPTPAGGLMVLCPQLAQSPFSTLPPTYH